MSQDMFLFLLFVDAEQSQDPRPPLTMPITFSPPSRALPANSKPEMADGYLMEKDNRPDAGGCRHGSGRWLSRSRFAIQDGRVKEVLVTLEGENLTEVWDEP